MSEAQPNARYVQSSLANVAPTSTPRQRSFESGATELAQRFVGAELAAPAQLLAGLSAFDNLEVTCAIIVEADVDESRLQVVGGVDGTALFVPQAPAGPLVSSALSIPHRRAFDLLTALGYSITPALIVAFDVQIVPKPPMAATYQFSTWARIAGPELHQMWAGAPCYFVITPFDATRTAADILGLIQGILGSHASSTFVTQLFQQLKFDMRGQVVPALTIHFQAEADAALFADLLAAEPGSLARFAGNTEFAPSIKYGVTQKSVRFSPLTGNIKFISRKVMLDTKNDPRGKTQGKTQVQP